MPLNDRLVNFFFATRHRKTFRTIMLSWVAILSTTFLTPPPALHASALPGNVGFDPLGLSMRDFFNEQRSDDERLRDYREAELKHGRLAMLAAVAWPAQELLHPRLAETVTATSLLTERGLSPSLVNGGLEDGRIPGVLLLFGVLASLLEVTKMSAEERQKRAPGDYGWRIGVDVRADAEALFDLRAGEVWNGRVAMMAVLGYVVQEALRQVPVLDALF